MAWWGRRSKYGARKVLLDGQQFDSQREADRYLDLRLAERAGMIAELELHPVYELVVNGWKIGRYTPDFRYRLVANNQLIVEDVKGVRTRDYVLRRKLMRALYDIEVLET